MEMPGNPNQARKLFERGFERQQAGDLGGAERLYQASIAERPTAEAHTFLGWVYSLGRRYHDAIRECKRAIALDPSFGNPYNDIGVYLMELGREKEAIPWLERAMKAPRYEAPHFPHVNLARIYERSGDTVAALAELTKAEEKAGRLPELTLAIRRLQGKVN
jgi:tetratricopeptide (TPR) repeat protein